MNFAVVLAGGSGRRMGADTPKQFISVHGKPIIIHSLEAFASHPEIDGIVAVCKADCIDELRTLTESFAVKKLVAIVPGGDTRQMSVYNGISRIPEQDAIVLIHDGVRPLVSEKIIRDNISAAKKYGAVNTVIPASDTILISRDGVFIDDVPERGGLFHAQTPQSFQLPLIKAAHEAAAGRDEAISATDDCQLVLRLGHRVAMVDGSRTNIKITTQQDLIFLEALL